MKKIVSILLALAMLLGCVSALADYPTFSFTTEQYTTQLDQLAAAMSMSVTWAGSPSYEYGYPMTYGRADLQDMEIYVSVHDLNGVICVEFDGYLTDGILTEENGNIFGQYMALAYSPVYLLNPTATQQGYQQAMRELMALVAALDTAESAEATVGGVRCVVKTAPVDNETVIALIMMPEDSNLM